MTVQTARGHIRSDGKVLVVTIAYDPALVTEVKAIPGRRFDPTRKCWTIPTTADACAGLAAFATRHGLTVADDARALMAGATENAERNLTASRATAPTTTPTATAPTLDLTGIGGTLRPFQVAGVEYLVGAGRALLGDDMGTGKTPQTLATLHALKAFPALVICPASVKFNWEREALKWLPGRSVQVLNGKVAPITAEIVVVNYDLLGKWRDALIARGFAALIVDESHYVKNRDAQRTAHVRAIATGVEMVKAPGSSRKAAHKLGEPIRYRFALSGTMVVNRPEELVAQLDMLGRLDEFGGAWGYLQRYCNAHKTRFGWDFSGASNTVELNRKLRASCYIRREKRDVLPELPEKTRTVLPVALSNAVEYRRRDAELVKWMRSADPTEAAALVRIEELKQLCADGKLDAAREWIADFLDQTDRKIVVFATHRAIVEAIRAAFPSQVAGVITGDTAITDRQAIIDRFTDGAARILVANIQAGGTGINLQAASDELFLELAWTPAAHDQAEDRCYRMGQQNNVTAYYLLGRGTIDETIHALIESKREITTAVIDGSREATSTTSVLRDLIAAMAKPAIAQTPAARPTAQSTPMTTPTPEAPPATRFDPTEPCIGVIPDGWYTVVLDPASPADYVTLRLRAWESKGSGTQSAAYLHGPDNGADYTGFATVRGTEYRTWRAAQVDGRIANALGALLSGALDRRAAGRAYALRSGNCYICNRLLTTPQSVALGIGPVCAEGGGV